MSCVRNSVWFCFLSLSLAMAGPVSAETFIVVDDSDQQPAVEGTLRWAIEQSELNPGPDRIEFAIDFAHIELVAPLPDLQDGGLTLLGAGADVGHPVEPSAYTLSGAAGVERALTIASPDNRIGELRFVDFEGPEVILIAGAHARRTVISRCWFGDPSTGQMGGARAAIRIAPIAGQAEVAEGIEIVGCGFAHNDTAIVIEAGPVTVVPEMRRPPTLRRCWFGTSVRGGPGPGNRRVATVSGAPVWMMDCRLSGPGEGVHLLSGADNSRLTGNLFGVEGSDGVCGALSPAALHVEQAAGVVFDGNRVRCAADGVTLGVGADDAFINQNVFDGPALGGFSGSAVVLAGGSGGLVARNRIRHVDGAGIGSVSEAGPTNTLACNSISLVGGQAIDQAEPLVLPPELNTTGPLAVGGLASTSPPGWIEVFSDSSEQAERLMGALEVLGADPGFHFLLPAGLRIAQTDAGTDLGVSGDLAAHTATWTPHDLGETSALSLALPVGDLAPVFDLLRGDVANLALDPAGGVQLGPVDCLARATGEGFPVFTDEQLPEAGHAFFYLSRRRHPQAAGEVGSYNPPLCLDLLAASPGERIEGPGGCDP